MGAVASDADLIDFVYAEARLIDEKRLEEWYELFAEEGRYWLPLTRGQKNGVTENSLMFEDKLLLKLRIARLKSPHAYSQAQPELVSARAAIAGGRGQRRRQRHRRDAHAFLLRREPATDDQQLYTGVAWHHLVRVQERIRIILKKVELLNCEAALPSLELFP